MIDFDQYNDISKKWNIKDGDKTVSSLVKKYKKIYKQAIDKLNELREARSFSPYMRDRRTPEKYIEDLVEAWLVEDIILQVWLTQRLKKLFPIKEYPDFKIVNMGTDLDRKVQFTAKMIRANVTTAPDFLLVVQGRTKPIEFQFSRTSLKEYDMKEGKVNRIDKGRNLVFLWYIQPEDKFFFVDPKWLKETREPVVNFLWGGKMTYKVKSDEVRHYEMSEDFDENIKKILLS